MATGFDWDSLAVPGGAPAQLPTSPYDEIATNVATELDLDPALVRAMMFRESAGDPNALSPKGAGGLMQLMPETAAELGVQDVYNPEQNIRGGAQYYQQLQDQFGGERWKALAAYNAGPGRMREWEAQGITDPSQIPYPETRDYVSNVQGAYDQFRTPSQPVPMPGSPALAPPPIDPTDRKSVV